VTLVASSSYASSHENEPGDNYDPNSFRSDDAAAAEINRINSLQPSKIPVLNEASREEINSARRLYSQELSNLGELIGARLDDIKKDTDVNVGKQLDQPVTIDGKQENIRGIIK